MLTNITFLDFMTSFHIVAHKVKTGCATSVFKPIWETRNVNNVCDYVWLFFLTKSNYLGPLMSVVLKLTVCPIDQKT